MLKLKLDEPFRIQEIFIIPLFFKRPDLGSESKKVFFFSFWLKFCPFDPDPWIRLFFWIRIMIHEAKILRIQRIRILCTGLKGL